MKKYKQLTEGQRYEIAALKKHTDLTQQEIADKVGVHKSTVSRELKRNSKRTSKGDVYEGGFAENLSRKRRGRKKCRNGFTDGVCRRIRWLLRRCKKKGLEMVSAESIYQWIYDLKAKGEDLTKYLRRSRKKRRKRSGRKGKRQIIKDRRPLSERPSIVDRQERTGDIEVDLVKCTNGYLLTCTDRKSLFNIIEKMPNKSAAECEKALDRALMPYMEKIHTITSDNGTEFVIHKSVAETVGVDWFFARPYRSCERGCNENQNGLIRQFAPRGLDLSKVGDGQVKQWQHILNHRPRKKIDFDKPIDLFLGRTVALAS